MTIEELKTLKEDIEKRITSMIIQLEIDTGLKFDSFILHEETTFAKKITYIKIRMVL